MAEQHYKSFESPLRTDARSDLLSDVVDHLNVHGWVSGRLALTSPWGIQVNSHLGWFYLVTQNQCVVEVEGQAIPVSAGDLIIIGQGISHSLRDRSDSPLTSIQALLEPNCFERGARVVFGGGGVTTRVLCGCLFVDELERSLLWSVLPAVIHIKGRHQRPVPYVDHLVCLLDLEADTKGPGAQAIINRLVRILFLKAIQGYMSELPRAGAGWLGALEDPRIGRAISLMHTHPEAGWTVNSLAKQVAMARSTFSARFVELVGRSPLEYLTDWRMQKACSLLRAAQAELKEVATRVGYGSVAGFSKVFTRWAGKAPGAYRRSWRVVEFSGVPGTPHMEHDGRRSAASVGAPLKPGLSRCV